MKLQKSMVREEVMWSTAEKDPAYCEGVIRRHDGQVEEVTVEAIVKHRSYYMTFPTAESFEDFAEFVQELRMKVKNGE